MTQIEFSDDRRRPSDEFGEPEAPNPQHVLFKRRTGESVSEEGYVYNTLTVEYTEDSATPGAVLKIISYWDCTSTSDAFDGSARLKVQISVDNFAHVLSTYYIWAGNVYTRFNSGGSFTYYARANSNRSVTISFNYSAMFSASVPLPVTGQAYKVRIIPETSWDNGQTWSNAGYNSPPPTYQSFAPVYIPITPPAHVYLNGVNTFGASIGAVYITELSAGDIHAETGSMSTTIAPNPPVRSADYPYISTGQATSYIYWFPQFSEEWAWDADGSTYSITLRLFVVDPGDADFTIPVGETVITGTVEYAAEDDESMFSASVQISDPSGLYSTYGYLLRNTDATVVCRAVITPHYGAKMIVAYRPMIDAYLGNQGYGYGYSPVYQGREPKTIELAQQLPESGSSGSGFTTGIRAFGYSGGKATLGTYIDPLASQQLTATILDYAVPSFPNLSIHRCNTDGTANDNGDHCKIEWAVSIVPIGNQNSKNLTIVHPEGTTQFALSSYSQAGTLIVAADTESAYDVIFTLADDLNTVTRTLRLSTAGVIMDWLFGGKGVAFGRVAETEQAVEISDEWALIVAKILFAGQDLSVWMGEIATRLKAAEQFISNTGSTAQFDVSFYDGSELLDRQWVMAGDDADDPDIVPERAATSTTVYSFAGWALTEGATVADQNALRNITAARLIYAAYSEATRYYTVTYLNGGTELQRVSNILYRGSAAYSGSTPTSEAGTFAGWSPSGLQVVNSEEAQAQFLRDEEITDSWDEIIAACNDGSYKTKYSLGMYKLLGLGELGSIHMVIHAFQADYVSRGQRKVPITWIAKEALAVDHRMNPALVENTHQESGSLVIDSYETGTGAIGGWAASEMRSYLANTILPRIPEIVRNGIKEVRKITGSEVSNTSAASLHETVPNEETIDKLCIPSHQELFGNDTHEYAGIDFEIVTARRQKIKAGNTSNAPYFLRTVSPGSTTSFEQVTADGAISTLAASSASGVVIEFCT